MMPRSNGQNILPLSPTRAVKVETLVAHSMEGHHDGQREQVEGDVIPDQILLHHSNTAL